MVKLQVRSQHDGVWHVVKTYEPVYRKTYWWFLCVRTEEVKSEHQCLIEAVAEARVRHVGGEEVAVVTCNHAEDKWPVTRWRGGWVDPHR